MELPLLVLRLALPAASSSALRVEAERRHPACASRSSNFTQFASPCGCRSAPEAGCFNQHELPLLRTRVNWGAERLRRHSHLLPSNRLHCIHCSDRDPKPAKSVASLRTSETASGPASQPLKQPSHCQRQPRPPQPPCTSAGPRMASCGLTTRLASANGSLSGARPEQRSGLNAAALVAAPRRRRSSASPVQASALAASTPLVLQLAPAAAWTLVGVMALRVFMGEQQVCRVGGGSELKRCERAGACWQRTPHVPGAPAARVQPFLKRIMLLVNIRRPPLRRSLAGSASPAAALAWSSAGAHAGATATAAAARAAAAAG